MFSVGVIACVVYISYQWITRPELTEMQLFVEYWPVCIASGLFSLLMSIFLALDRREKRAMEDFERNMRKR